jgi:hypothetical protein
LAADEISKRDRTGMSLFAAVHESAIGPRLPTWALQQVGSYLGYTGHQISRHGTQTLGTQRCCSANSPVKTLCKY